MFSCELCEFFKNVYFEEHLRGTSAASVFVTEKVMQLTSVAEKTLKIRHFKSLQSVALLMVNQKCFIEYVKFPSMLCIMMHC